MRQHKVYQHEEKGYYAIKVGFAWYGFFFSFFWLAFKKLFFWMSFFIILLTIIINLSSLDYIMFFKLFTLSTPKDPTLLGLLSMFSILIGLMGNKWLSINLEKNGYQLVETIPSISKKEAIIQTQNVKSSKSPAFAAWGRQDSYQPGHRHIKKDN